MAIKKIQIVPEGSNNYGDIIHPETSADMVIESTTKRFVSDAEKLTWNNKASTSVVTTSANGLMSSADKTKLDGVATGAQVNTVTSVAGKTGAVTLAKADVGLSSVDDVKQMPIAGGTFTGIATAQANTSYTTKQIRNITLSTSDPSGGSNGDVWLKYAP